MAELELEVHPRMPTIRSGRLQHILFQSCTWLPQGIDDWRTLNILPYYSGAEGHAVQFEVPHFDAMRCNAMQSNRLLDVLNWSKIIANSRLTMTKW